MEKCSSSQLASWLRLPPLFQGSRRQPRTTSTTLNSSWEPEAALFWRTSMKPRSESGEEGWGGCPRAWQSGCGRGSAASLPEVTQLLPRY